MSEPGHNTLGMDRDAFLSLYAQECAAAQAVAEAAAVVAEKKKAHKRVRKQMMADGIIMGEYDVMKSMEGKPQEENAAAMGRIAHMAQTTGALAQGVQLDFFQVTDDPLLERAYQNGEMAACAHKGEHDNPHDPNTAAGQKWIEGFRARAPLAAEARRKATEAETEATPEPMGADDTDEEPEFEAADDEDGPGILSDDEFDSGGVLRTLDGEGAPPPAAA